MTLRLLGLIAFVPIILMLSFPVDTNCCNRGRKMEDIQGKERSLCYEISIKLGSN